MSEFQLGTPNVPIADQIACVAREIAMRERVYPRLIRQQRMSDTKAHQEIQAMRAVLRTLQGLSE